MRIRRRARTRQDGPIRIAYLTPDLDAGGAERQMLILAQTLAKSSFEVRFLLLSARGVLVDEAEAAGARVHVLGLDRAHCAGIGLRCLPMALRALRRYRALTADVDIVDAWLIPSMIFAALAQPFARGPVLLGGRRSLGDVYATKSRVRRLLATVAARRMTVIVANSRIAAGEARQIDGIGAERIRVIPNAVLPASGHTERRASARAGWRFDDSQVVVGCVGNYKPGKGLLSLLTVADQLRQERPELRYVLVGEGPLRSDLEDGIERLALHDIVVLHGRDADARSLYGSFDIYVQASDSEGLPNVILEAAASGLPIVATAVGGTSEILTSNVDGILVAKGDVHGLASAVSELAADPGLRDRLGRAALARSADYAPARLAESTAALYRGLLGREVASATDGDDRAASIDA